jgi:hypothetical protein
MIGTSHTGHSYGKSFCLDDRKVVQMHLPSPIIITCCGVSSGVSNGLTMYQSACSMQLYSLLFGRRE